MKDYIIYTDSTADLSPELVALSGVKVIPLEFSICGKSYFNYPEGTEIGFAEFYNKVREGNAATTSLVNAERYRSIFEEELKAGNDLLYICFSSGLSGSYNCCRIAVEELSAEYPNRSIRVVDSLAASMGEGLLVYNAVEQKKSGKSLDEVAGWVEENRNHLCHWFTVDDLNHLKRGGRLSAAAAVVGTMLNIKPILHVDDEGHLVPVSKVRGRKTSLDAIVAEMEKTVIDPENQVIFVSHGDSEEDCNYVVEAVMERFKVKKVYTNYIGPVIGAHSGPGTIALFFLGTHK